MVSDLYKRFADSRGSKAILKKRFVAEEVSDENFNADVSIMEILETNSVWNVPRDNGESVCILDKNYKFLGVYPKDESYAITGIFNEQNKLVELYFDMTKENGVEDGRPYVVDIFLDLVITPENEKYVLDEDELEEALDRNIIGKAEFNLAYETLHRLEEKYKSQEDVDKLSSVMKNYLDDMLVKIKD